MSAIRRAVAAAQRGAAGPVYVGYSGGLDSTVLLHAAAATAAPAVPVVAVHVNHGLHPQAARWQRHCADVCSELGVACVARVVEVAGRGGLEARARSARYRVFAELLARPGSLLLLAHHGDDQTETALLRLLQGRGLYGMPQARPLAAGRLVRPLLYLPRSVLADYARAQGLRWVDDPGNADDSMDRNYLRHRVLPVLRQRWPDLDGALAGALERARLADELITAGLGDLARSDSLAVSAVTGRDAAERPELLRLWLAARGVAAPPRGALAEFARQLDACNDRQPALGAGPVTLRRYRGRIYLTAAPPRLEACYRLPLPGSLRLPHGELRVLADATGFAPSGTLEVRFRRGGERLSAGRHHRPVKQLLQDAGVPPWQRDIYPLVYDGAGLAGVPGIAHRQDGATPDGARYRAEWHPD